LDADALGKVPAFEKRDERLAISEAGTSTPEGELVSGISHPLVLS
jgi:hypothetical protein